MIVFADSKDRRVPGATLHANFSLSANGEYLGLIKPDGVTVATSMTPSVPCTSNDCRMGMLSPSTCG